jgi:hypothetical protein
MTSPKWSKVTSFYGPPKVIGLNTGQPFQEKVVPEDQLVASVDTFNLGTNFFCDLPNIDCWNTEQMRKLRNTFNGKSLGKYIIPQFVKRHLIVWMKRRMGTTMT